jgi:acetyltransferase-like isoleucine patch superfamily enzyme
MFKLFIQLIIFLFPWGIRRKFLNKLFDFNISPTAKIGISLLNVKKLILDDSAQIGHLNFFNGLDLVYLKSNAIVNNLNWISAFPSNNRQHFSEESDRQPILLLGKDSAITNRHLIDCTNMVCIGNYSTIAGFRSQIMTHSIDIYSNKQTSYPVYIGDYCFLGSNLTILSGANIKDKVIIAAGSVVPKDEYPSGFIYGGIPAKPIKEAVGVKYFDRLVGFVD